MSHLKDAVISNISWVNIAVDEAIWVVWCHCDSRQNHYFWQLEFLWALITKTGFRTWCVCCFFFFFFSDFLLLATTEAKLTLREMRMEYTGSSIPVSRRKSSLEFSHERWLSVVDSICLPWCPSLIESICFHNPIHIDL